MKKIISYTILLAIILLSASSPIIAARSKAFLGVGLDRLPPQKNSDGTIREPGRTLYQMQDMNELGPVWVYNWTLPKPNKNYANDPYQDFGNRFIPMVFGCTATANESVMKWIRSNSYEGYVLFLNEPDNSGAGGGSACLPQTAVAKLDNFITLKNEYKQQTGKSIDIIFGGTFWGPDMCMPTYKWCGKVYNGKFWIDDFIDKWRAAHNQADPDIAGMHFHLYPWNPVAKSKPDLIAHLKRRMEGGRDPNYQVTLPGWNDWLDRNAWARGTNDEIWITETGILDGSISKTVTNGVLAELIPYLESNNRIDRVAWFVYDLNDKAGYAPGYDQTALMNLNHTTRSISWNTFKNLCTNQRYCVGSITVPTGTPTLTLTPIAPSPTRTLTPVQPSPTRTPTPIRPSATRTPTLPPINTPTPTTQPTNTPTRTPSATLTPTPGAGTVIRVKDTRVASNSISNAYMSNFSCQFGYWCKWQRVSTSTNVINADGSISVKTAPRSGDFGSCWIQWIQGAKADGSSYRVRATFDGDFPLNTTFIQMQTLNKVNYLRTPWYTTGRTSIDETVTISDSYRDFVAIKFCSYGTQSSAISRTATLRSLSVEKLAQ